MTYAHPWYTQQQQLASSTTSESESTRKLKPVAPGQKHTNCPSFKGDFYEHIVILEAMKRGAHVYKNVGCSGKTDMIIECNGRTIAVDVKASSTNNSPGVGVSLVHVDVDSHDVRWGRPRTITSDWKDFWS